MSAVKTAIVTGANSGIGYEAVKSLLQSSKLYHVFLGSRSVENGNTALEQIRKECPNSSSTVELLEVDLTSDDSIQKAYDTVNAKSGKVDVLINNAGATFDLDFIEDKMSLRDCFNRAYDVNVSGTNVMTWTFMPLLLKSSEPRLIFVGGLSSITSAAEKYFPTPPQPAGWPKKIGFETIGYRCSKVALNMLMLDWNHKLKEDGVKVWAVAPGMLATNLGKRPHLAKTLGLDLRPASDGGDIIRRVAEGERDADVGKFVAKNGGFVEW